MDKHPYAVITGTRWGLGEALYSHRPLNYYVGGLNRKEGHLGLPTGDCMRDFLMEIRELNPDIFINCTYGAYDVALGEDPNPQLTLFREVLSLWQDDPSKTIINVCSIAAYHERSMIIEHGPVGQTRGAVEFQRRYRQNKAALLAASEQATLDVRNVRCRVSAISPGYVETKRTDTPKHANNTKMTAKDCAGYIWWLIQQPQTIRIPHLSVFAVNEGGYISNR
jgi:hypothetical protein